MTALLTRKDFAGGHRIEGQIFEFPHLCPGEGCAVGEWLKQKHQREEYEQLPRADRVVAESTR